MYTLCLFTWSGNQAEWTLRTWFVSHLDDHTVPTFSSGLVLYGPAKISGIEERVDSSLVAAAHILCARQRLTNQKSLKASQSIKSCVDNN